MDIAVEPKADSIWDLVRWKRWGQTGLYSTIRMGRREVRCAMRSTVVPSMGWDLVVSAGVRGILSVQVLMDFDFRCDEEPCADRDVGSCLEKVVGCIQVVGTKL